jgi:hypothetical protein
MTTTATRSFAEIAEFWRVARRLYTIYAELNRTFELGVPLCPELESNVGRAEPEALERVRAWMQSMDARVQVWQIRQLLQSTSLQSEESLRYLINRHLIKDPKADSDKEKIDFLLVQYFAHSAPHSGTEMDISLESVARVLEPALGARPTAFPEWTASLDEKLLRMNDCKTLEELQDSGGLLEAREMKVGVGEQYFEPSLLVAFTRFNFLARRAFFRAMHLDLHAIRALLNEAEKRGFSSIDCSEAGLSANESLDQVRHVIHQWKTPFRAPYSGGSSFQQLIRLRHALQRALDSPPAEAQESGKSVPVNGAGPSGEDPSPPLSGGPDLSPGDQDYLRRCVADIGEQLSNLPRKAAPTVSSIHLGGTKLLIASWEAEAFQGETEAAVAMQKAVGARTILHVSMDRHKRGESTDLVAAMELAERQAAEIKLHVAQAKEANNIDAAVNLAATAKRLLSLVEEGRKLQSVSN